MAVKAKQKGSKNRIQRHAHTKQAAGLSSVGALTMFRGTGDSAYTYYVCSIVEKARRLGVGLWIVKRDKETGKMEKVLTKVRMVHRESLLGTFGDTHKQAGEGKYVRMGALSGKTIAGVRNVNPYLAGGKEGCDFTTIQALQHSIPNPSQARGLKSKCSENDEDGTHMHWLGKRNPSDAVLTSSWLSEEELWGLACKINPGLAASLRSTKSGQEKVTKHLNPREKFKTNLNVLRRSRKSFQVITGTTIFGGGATPYSLPLEQCEFAIDKFFLTDGFDKEGNETGDYYYRLAVGRSTPHVLYKRNWKGLGTESRFAYKTDAIWQTAKRREKTAA